MSPLLVNVALLLVSAVAIYLSCEYFVNGVEWAGRKLNLEQKATGTILAAIGTALPESVVTFVAVAFGHDETQKQLGIGAALGGPLVLATVAYAVVGWVMLSRSRATPTTAPLDMDQRQLSRDQGWFLLIFIAKIALGLVAFAFKPWLGVLFLAGYAAYFWKEISGRTGEAQEDLEPLKLAPRSAVPSTALVLLQTGAALAVIFAASRFFVGQLDDLTPHLGLPPQLVALLLSPIATELPETMNAIIWVRQGKVGLALANISGAMMIQATVPSAFGIFFTPWMLDRPLVYAGIVTMLSVAALYALFRAGRMTARILSFFALFYALFVVLLLV